MLVFKIKVFYFNIISSSSSPYRHTSMREETDKTILPIIAGTAKKKEAGICINESKLALLSGNVCGADSKNNVANRESVISNLQPDL